MTCILSVFFCKNTVTSKTCLLLDIKVELLKGWVTKRDLGCVVNCKVGCKIHHAVVPCCPTLDTFDTAKSGAMYKGWSYFQ